MRRVALLLGAVAVAFGAAVLAPNGRSAPWPFKGVTPAELASQGVTLSPRSTPGTLATTASSAAAVASKFQGRPAEQVAYMHGVDTTRAPRLDQDCWAITLNAKGMTAPGGMLGRPSPIVRYAIVFVDPSSGKVIEGQEG